MRLVLLPSHLALVFGFKVKTAFMGKVYKAVAVYGLTFGHWSLGLMRWDKNDTGAHPHG